MDMNIDTIDIEGVRDDVGELIDILCDAQALADRALAVAGRLEAQIATVDIHAAIQRNEPIADVYRSIWGGARMVHNMFPERIIRALAIELRLLRDVQAGLNGPLQATEEASVLRRKIMDDMRATQLAELRASEGVTDVNLQQLYSTWTLH